MTTKTRQRRNQLLTHITPHNWRTVKSDLDRHYPTTLRGKLCLYNDLRHLETKGRIHSKWIEERLHYQASKVA